MKTLLFTLLLVSGCSVSRKVEIHPLYPTDFFEVKSGTKVGDYVAVKDGYFCSEYFLANVAKARVNK